MCTRLSKKREPGYEATCEVAFIGRPGYPRILDHIRGDLYRTSHCTNLIIFPLPTHTHTHTHIQNMALVPADEYSSSESDEDSNDSSPAAPHYRPTIVAEGTLEEVGVGDTEGLLASEALPGLYLPQSKRVGTSKCKLIEEVT